MPAQSMAAPRPGSTVPREAPATGPLASPGVARLVGFVPLALFGALHWGGLVRPGAPGAMVLAVMAATAGGAVLLLASADERRWVRVAAAGGVTFALLVLAIVVAGVPLRLLKPAGWADLLDGLGQGISALPAITVPYRGADEWVRVALVSSGAALTAVAALVAFWPRRDAPTPGHPIAAAIALGALYTVPIVEQTPRAPYLGGAVFCVLLATFLWLERLRADQVGVGACCIVGAAALGVVAAPRLDASQPWLDYEQIAENLEPAKAATFSWDHSYGPMTWPRDGREVLRIRAARQAYWKTVNLDEFDGLRWIDSGQVRSVVDTEIRRTDWIETIRVVDRGVRSRQFIGAGHMLAVLRGGPNAVGVEPGTFQTTSRPLGPGSSYQARVYVPNPTNAQLRRAGVDFPDFTTNYLDIDLPRRLSRTVASAVRFKPYGVAGPPDAAFSSGFQPQDGLNALRSSPYERAYQLAQSLKRGTTTPYDFVQRVLARVQNGATYSESPPPAQVPLMDFLFGAKLGYCQQFSGAMAMLLRMGGVPARVAAGFSPGRFDSRRGEYIVRDDDAHSWVEAYFPRIGWVTFDPTPAASPARSQLSDTGRPVIPARRPDLGLNARGDRPDLPGDPRGNLADQGGPSPVALGLLGVAVLMLAALGVVLTRRGRLPDAPLGPEVAELQRALHRTGRTPPPAITLSGLERLLGGSEGAREYLRAVRAQRFGVAATGPTPAQRRALRRELAVGLGATGRLRAWWALPPVMRRRGPYTG